MTCKINRKKGMAVMKNRILFITLIISCLFFWTADLKAQPASASPSKSSDQVKIGDYDVTSTIELGVRGLRFNGSDEKYRSDLNYRPGFRLFDSSYRMETDKGKGKAFDSLSITSSGWSADPSGYVRVDMEKSGSYRFKANVRRVQVINRLSNFVLGYNKADTKRNFGDFDITVFPENEKLKLDFGVSFNRYYGDLGFTVRTRDVFPIIERINSNTIDYRAGIKTKLAGFNLTFSGGDRNYNDRSKYVIDSRNAGFVPTDVNFINKLERLYPTNGDTKYGMFSMQRTFAKKLDLTGRIIYSVTDRGFNVFENFNGEGPISRTNPTLIFTDADIITWNGRVKRPQTRADLGVTYSVTDNFRISNTFTFDQFNSSGDSAYAEKVVSRLQSTGAARPDTLTSTFYYNFDGYKRFTNTIEGDFQLNTRFGFHLGYRYGHRKVNEAGDIEENTTNTLIVGAKIKPTKSWSIFADAEHGTADNAFTRLSNYDFDNIRVRSIWNYKQFNFNVSGIIRNNENPSVTTAIGLVPAGPLVANVRNRTFSANVDWTPDPRWSLNTGFVYTYLTSKTDIVVPLAALTQGFSEFQMRDKYGFIDVSARPIDRVSFFASYRFDIDNGTGSRFQTAAERIISSYPFQFHTPEFRIAIKLTKNVDWNLGYQYNSYKEKLQIGYFSLDTFPTNVNFLPNQNYQAHLPYTSLRIYFGGRE